MDAAPWILVVVMVAVVASRIAAAVARRTLPSPGPARVTFAHSARLRLLMLGLAVVVPLVMGFVFELRGAPVVFTVGAPVVIAALAGAGFVDVSSAWISADDRGLERWTPWSGHGRIAWADVSAVRRVQNYQLTAIASRSGPVIRLSDMQEGRGWIAVALLAQLGDSPVIEPEARAHLAETVQGLEEETGRPARWPPAA